MLQFCPTLVRAEGAMEFPRPVTVCRIHDSWDAVRLKVPRRDGDRLAGNSRDGVDITLEGQFGSQSGELKLSEPEMLETLLTLRTALHPADDAGYILSLYQNDVETDFRHFRHCTTVRFDFDLSSSRIYGWSVVIHAADTVLYNGLLP